MLRVQRINSGCLLRDSAYLNLVSHYQPDKILDLLSSLQMKLPYNSIFVLSLLLIKTAICLHFIDVEIKT